MKVCDVARQEVVTIAPTESILAAARLMRDRHVGDVVVVERRPVGAIPLGILTDRDLVIGVLAQEVRDLAKVHVEDAMNRDLLTVSSDAELTTAMNLMRARGVRRLPVVNDLEVLAGILTYDDLVHFVCEELADFSSLFAIQARHERARRF